MQCASELLAARASVATDAEALYLLKAVGASCALMLSTITNVLDLRSLELWSGATQGGMGELRTRELCNLLEKFADVLEICRIACSKEIAWVNELEARLHVPAELEVRR